VVEDAGVVFVAAGCVVEDPGEVSAGADCVGAGATLVDTVGADVLLRLLCGGALDT
jgi:hypothetical protein